MKWGREANIWQGLVRYSKEFAISSLNSGLERGTYKVLCQRTQSGDLVRMELKPLYTESSALTTGVDGMGWCSHKILKEKKSGGWGEGKRKERELLCWAMLAWTLIIYLSKEFLKHSFASFLLLKHDDTFPAGVYPNTRRLRYFHSLLEENKNAYHEYQPL